MVCDAALDTVLSDVGVVIMTVTMSPLVMAVSVSRLLLRGEVVVAAAGVL